MTWNTHVAVGMNSLWLLPAMGNTDITTYLIAIPLTALASLLPDIDANSAKIHFLGGGILRGFSGSAQGKYFHHRGITHSFFAGLIIFLIIFVISQNIALALVISIAYLSHPIIDGFNTTVGYFYPFYLKRFALLPRLLQFKVKSTPDKIIFIIASFLLVSFLMLVLPKHTTLNPQKPNNPKAFQPILNR